MTERLSKQRNDIIQTPEDFARVMEDYFGIIPPEVNQFDLDRILFWDYDDVEHSMTFYFEDPFDLNALVEHLQNTPKNGLFYIFDEYQHLDRDKLTLTIIGKIGGLR